MLHTVLCYPTYANNYLFMGFRQSISLSGLLTVCSPD